MPAKQKSQRRTMPWYCHPDEEAYTEKFQRISLLHSVYIFVQQTRTIYMKVNLSNEKKNTEKTMRMMKRKEKKSELEWESVPS